MEFKSTADQILFTKEMLFWMTWWLKAHSSGDQEELQIWNRVLNFCDARRCVISFFDKVTCLLAKAEKANLP